MRPGLYESSIPQEESVVKEKEREREGGEGGWVGESTRKTINHHTHNTP